MNPATEEQRRGMNRAVLSQCLGYTSILALQNNLLLLYFAAMGIGSSRIVVYLAMPLVVDVTVRLPMAYLADRVGKKRVSLVGQAFAALGYVLLAVAGWAPGLGCEVMVVLGLCLFGGGHGAFASSWFALLSPVVPHKQRGSFFGRVQYSSQTVGIVVAGLSATWLGSHSPLWQYQVILGVIAAGMALRMVSYSGIPEFEAPTGDRAAFGDALRGIVRSDPFVSFCAYLFLITMFTAACPAFFGLVQKRVLDLGDGQVAWLGNLLVIGALCGFYTGGRLVDRCGTRPVFLIGHFVFAIAIWGFVLRGLFPMPAAYVAGAFVFLFGAVQAASNIAFTTEMLALIPPEAKSLSTSLALVLSRGGTGLMGVLSASVLNLGLLVEQWDCAGLRFSAYDSILMGFGMMVVLLVATLGLVPSVRGTSPWAPEN